MERATTEDMERTALEILDAYEAYTKTLNEQRPELMQLVSLYLPDNMDKFVVHAVQMGEFSGTLLRHKPMINATPELKVTANKMRKTLSDFLVAIREEMKRPPF